MLAPIAAASRTSFAPLQGAPNPNAAWLEGHQHRQQDGEAQSFAHDPASRMSRKNGQSSEWPGRKTGKKIALTIAGVDNAACRHHQERIVARARDCGLPTSGYAFSDQGHSLQQNQGRIALAE